MDNNLQMITWVVDYIETHLDGDLDLDSLARAAGYSKYHLHRMFGGIAGFTIHSYVQRRRLTEAARALIFSDKPVMEIALLSGYETQQSFSVACKSLFKYSPQEIRKRRDFCPLQLKLNIDGRKQLRGDMIMDVRITESSELLLIGYSGNTQNGFAVIGQCMTRLHAAKDTIRHRADPNCLIGLNDYSNEYDCDKEQPSFDFYGAVEVNDCSEIPNGMVTKKLPAGKYVVFRFTGRPQDSLQPVADYIYKEWFPQSTCQFTENNKYDFTKNYESTDSDGNSLIEYWIPIL